MNDFPTSIQPIIDQGFLDREFFQALKSRKSFRDIAEKRLIPIQIGEAKSEIQTELKKAWGTEHYNISMNHYAAMSDLNTKTTRVGFASSIFQNAYLIGEQAARSLNKLARNTLFSAYFAGNTRITKILHATEFTITFDVDDIRGFQTVFVNGEPRAVSREFPLEITIGAQNFNAIYVDKYLTNTSTTPGGISGTIQIVSDEIPNINDPVIASSAPKIIRPNQAQNTQRLNPNNKLTMNLLLDAVATLRLNAVPEIDGVYNCYLDPISARQLFADLDFRMLFQGATLANQIFRHGIVSDFLGLRFIPTYEIFTQPHPTLRQETIRRVAICGAGTLIEGVFPDLEKAEVAPEGSNISIVDNIAMVTRMESENTITQSWYWIGGFAAPVNAETGRPERAVIIEHV